MVKRILEKMSEDRAVTLNNARCIYCGVDFEFLKKTREHVIGRRFVPKGQLERSWNLIAWSCQPCNSKKAELEDDISAISMHPGLAEPQGERDQLRIDEASRKGKKSIHRGTRRPVSDSHEKSEFSVKLHEFINLDFKFIAPPQMDEERALALAAMHCRAIFYLITYDESSRVGRYWKGHFTMTSCVMCGDWGNIRIKSFAEMTKNWEHRFICFAAEGYFKVAIKKADKSRFLWSWALEWNKNFRLSGFFGEDAEVQAAVKLLPFPKKEVSQIGPNEFVAVVMDAPLKEEDDFLFYAKEFDAPDEEIRP